MNRRDLLLAVLAAAGGRPYTPVQIQKALFLVTQNLPGLVEGPTYEFSAYDYGPFDPQVYNDAQLLSLGGLVAVAPSAQGRWNTYAVSDDGLDRGGQLLAQMERSAREYIEKVSAWVRSLSFSALVKSIYEAYPDMKKNSIFRG